MSNISMVEAKLPPGFRFHPRDDELVCDYLLNKINGSDSLHLLIEVDLNKCEPWDLPEKARVGGKEWYFYSKRDRKYATGVRTNRATSRGYWKATGKDRRIVKKESVVGMRKTLVFYQGRAPKGRKTDWVMHEFRLLSSSPVLLQEDWVLCRVFYKKREESEKSHSTRSYDDTDTGCSSSLPPLMDSYITFDQTQPNKLLHHDYNEQVPCFSIFSHNQASLIFPQFDPTSNNLNSFGLQLPITTPPNFDNINDFSSDNKIIKAFLNQLNNTNNMDSNSNNNIQNGGSPSNSESYLSEVGMSNIWANNAF